MSQALAVLVSITGVLGLLTVAGHHSLAVGLTVCVCLVTYLALLGVLARPVINELTLLAASYGVLGTFLALVITLSLAPGAGE